MKDETPNHAAWTNGLVVRQAHPEVMRLFCLPYAGGGASMFRALRTSLAPAVEVYPIQPPGRESRWHESALRRMPDLIRALDDALSPVLEGCYALFGHSMGAFVAFELARKRRRDGRPGPQLLIASGARAPQLPDPDSPLHSETADNLLAEMKRYDGIPREVLEHPEFVALLLPTLRADLEVCETYQYAPEPPLDCPIAAYCGEGDEKVRPAALSAWCAQTSGGFRIRSFPGGHFFFLNESRDAVAKALAEDVGRIIASVRGRSLGNSRTQVEVAIARVWQQVLRVPAVRPDDNFFDLGGNSLLMIEAHAQLRQTVSSTVSVLDLFQYPTVRLLAGKLQSSAERPSIAFETREARRDGSAV